MQPRGGGGGGAFGAEEAADPRHAAAGAHAAGLAPLAAGAEVDARPQDTFLPSFFGVFLRRVPLLK